MLISAFDNDFNGNSTGGGRYNDVIRIRRETSIIF
jgi:hypothetical protein